MRKRFHLLYTLYELFEDIGRKSTGSPYSSGAELKLLCGEPHYYTIVDTTIENGIGVVRLLFWLGGVNHNIGEGVMRIVSDKDGLSTLKQLIDKAADELNEKEKRELPSSQPL